MLLDLGEVVNSHSLNKEGAKEGGGHLNTEGCDKPCQKKFNDESPFCDHDITFKMIVII